MRLQDKTCFSVDIRLALCIDFFFLFAPLFPYYINMDACGGAVFFESPGLLRSAKLCLPASKLSRSSYTCS